jgi:hypothetical protein
MAEVMVNGATPAFTNAVPSEPVVSVPLRIRALVALD